MHLDTPFSRLLGKPPIMVAGMTPSTVKAGFVSAVLNAGYHVELAGGGHYNAAALRSKVAEIQSKIPPGVGITLNALYINLMQRKLCQDILVLHKPKCAPFSEAKERPYRLRRESVPCVREEEAAHAEDTLYIR